MKVFFSAFKIILYTLIFLGIFNSTYGRTIEFNQDAKSISNYFSGLISFDNFDYAGSKGFFKKLDESQSDNKNYSSKFIQSLINLEKYQMKTVIQPEKSHGPKVLSGRLYKT